MRRAALPPAPDKYTVATTEAFKPPEGVSFEINPADPLWPQAQAWAHRNGLTQAAFNEGIDLFAGARVGDAATTKAAHDAEIAKLGVNGPARKTAIDTFLNASLGEDLGKHMSQFVLTSRAVEGFEKLVAKFTSQGVAPFSQQHREPANPQGKVSSEQFAKMSAAERLDYTSRFPQAQMPEWRDPRAA